MRQIVSIRKLQKGMIEMSKQVPTDEMLEVMDVPSVTGESHAEWRDRKRREAQERGES